MDVSKLVDAIVIGPYQPLWQRGVVESVVNALASALDVVTSALASDTALLWLNLAGARRWAKVTASSDLPRIGHGLRREFAP